MTYKAFLKGTQEKIHIWLSRPELVYLYVALIAVIGFAFITPPFQGPDEESHYVRAQYIAHGYLVPSNNASLPKSIADVSKVSFYDHDIRGKTNQRYDLHSTKAALKIALNSDGSYKPAMVTYNPILYLPAIPGILIANLLNLSPLISLYVARLSLGVIAVLLMFFAIKLLPTKKYLLVGVGLIPTMLFQQSVVTADSISYALLAVFIAYVLYLREKMNLTNAQWVKVGLLGLSVVLAKPLVFLFLPLIFLLVKKKDGIRWIVGIVAISVLILFSWNHLNTAKTNLDSAVIAGTSSQVDSAAQTKLLQSHPFRAIRVTWNSYMTSYGDNEVRGVIGIFGAADTIYPLWMFTAYSIALAILVIVTFDTGKKKEVRRVWKMIAVLLSFAYFAAVNLALYLTYTPVNFDIVYGVQGRYFLPIFIILATTVFTGGIKLSGSDSKKIKYWVIGSMTVLVFLALFITFQRYYLYTP